MVGKRGLAPIKLGRGGALLAIAAEENMRIVFSILGILGEIGKKRLGIVVPSES